MGQEASVVRVEHERERQKGMRLCVVMSDAVFRTNKGYATRHSFFLFVLSFSESVEKMVIFAPVGNNSDIENNLTLVPLPENVEIVPYPFFRGIRELYLKGFKILPRFIRQFLRAKETWDICWIVDSNIVSFSSYIIAKLYSKRVFIYLRANLQENLKGQFKNSAMKLIGYSVAQLEAVFIKLMKKDELFIVIGHELFLKYAKTKQKVRVFYANLISEKDLLRFRKGRAKQRKPRHEEGCMIKLLSVGRLTRQKGLEHVVYAAKELVTKKRYNLSWDIIGQGRMEGRLRNLVKVEGLATHFNFVGFVEWGEKLYSRYASAHIFVLSSLTEGFPKTIFEAMAFGLPIVATNVGGISAVIKHRENGILIESRSAHAIADAVHELCTDADLYDRISLGALETAQNFTIEKQQRRLIEEIEGL